MSLLLLGAGGDEVGGGVITSWTPANTGLTLGWYDVVNLANYDDAGGNWTKTYGGLAPLGREVNGPTKTTTGINGSTNALVFSGASNTHLYIQNPGISEFVIALVMDFSARNTDAPIVARPAQNQTRIIAFGGGGLRSEYLGGAADDYSVDTLSPSIIVTRHSKNQRVVRHNGVEVANSVTVTSGTEVDGSIYVGFYDSTVRDWTMSVSAFGIFYSSFFNGGGYTTALAERIEGYCAHHGSLGVSTAQLPVGHPYKVTPPTV